MIVLWNIEVRVQKAAELNNLLVHVYSSPPKYLRDFSSSPFTSFHSKYGTCTTTIPCFLSKRSFKMSLLTIFLVWPRSFFK